MTQWYYSDEARQRSGPHDAETMRAHYRQRRLQDDSLVWREGLQAWVPLRQVAAELALDTVVQDASAPPPLPSRAAAPAAYAPRRAAAEKKGMHGCLIALIVGAVVAVPLIGILAAIAIPAYQDYVERAKQAAAGASAYDPARMAEADEQVRTLLERAMTTYYPQQRQCPDTFEFESLQVRDASLAGYFNADPVDSGDNRCSYHVTFLQQGPMVDGKASRYDVVLTDEGVSVTCSTSELPADLRPPGCG